MSKTTEGMGCFMKTPCCTECNWWSYPLNSLHNGALTAPRSACPDCGAKIVEITGRYKIKETKGLFGITTTDYTDFVRKDVDKTEEVEEDMWLPTKADLPDEAGNYMVTFKTDDGVFVSSSVFDEGKWEYEGEPTFAKSFYIEVIAWQDHPSPYEE